MKRPGVRKIDVSTDGSLYLRMYSMTDQRLQRITSTTALRFGFLLEKRILSAENGDGNYYVLIAG